jgi:hypothetical protein
LIDAESGERVRMAVDESTREAYRSAFDNYADELKRVALRNGGRYAGLSTRINIEEAMFGTLTVAQGVY